MEKKRVAPIGTPHDNHPRRRKTDRQRKVLDELTQQAQADGFYK
jgi:hypothetical protein